MGSEKETKQSSEKNMSEVKGIPYGISDYELIRTGNYYYVDKTMYLEKIEKAGRYLFFIRPRRFGKSLFLSMMQAYYDVAYEKRFEEFFKGTYIFEHPTKERNSYLMMRFSFAAIDPGLGKIEDSFLEYTRREAVSFLKRYSGRLRKDRDDIIQSIKNSRSASDIMSSVFILCRVSGQKLFIVIDEYDNFANTILSSAGTDAYHQLTHGTGWFRSFFNILKDGSSGVGAPISRLFMTGVSPVTLDDVTSGYNIGSNISLDSRFNEMLGFTGEDVNRLIEYFREAGAVHHTTLVLKTLMTQWYGQYRFSEDANEKLFNSDMVLYFIDQYIPIQKIPRDLIDRNVRIDYGKLRHLIMTEKEKKSLNGNFNRLKQVLETGEITAKLEKGFPLEKIADTANFISLLFYFGLLTIKDTGLDDVVLTIPNETVRHLFYSYIKEGYEETDVFSMDMAEFNRLIKGMALNGEWKPLFDFIAGQMKESMALRDLVTGEKSIQAFLNVYLGLSNLYIIHQEKEMNKGFADLVLEPFLARYPTIAYSYLLEIKYIKPGPKKEIAPKTIDNIKTEAQNQLKQYSLDKKFNQTVEKTKLIKLILIFRGTEVVYREEI